MRATGSKHCFIYKGDVLCGVWLSRPFGSQRFWGRWPQLMRTFSGAVAVWGQPAEILEEIRRKPHTALKVTFPPKSPILSLLCLIPSVGFSLPSHRPGVLASICLRCRAGHTLCGGPAHPSSLTCRFCPSFASGHGHRSGRPSPAVALLRAPFPRLSSLFCFPSLHPAVITCGEMELPGPRAP